MVTPNWHLDYMKVAAMMSNVTANESLIYADSGICPNIDDSVSVTAPPSNPWNGDMLRVGATGTGAWVNLGGLFMFFYNGWRIIQPYPGFAYYDVNQNTKMFVYTVGWVSEASPGTYKSWTVA